MTVLEWVRIRRPRSTPVRHRVTIAFPVEGSTSDVPREYRGLYTCLEHRYASVVVRTCEQIEALIGFALPAAARTDREWWADSAQP